MSEFSDNRYHDILILTRDDELFQVPVQKTGRQQGEYTTKPFKMDSGTEGTRKARAVLEGVDDTELGFAISPTKPDPGSSHGTCYLINASNLRILNPWTSADWNEDPEASRAGEAPPDWGANEFEVIIAAPQGKLIKLNVSWNEDDKKPSVIPTFVDPQERADIWSQLRNGLVVGRTKKDPGQKALIPLVNITTLSMHGGE